MLMYLIWILRYSDSVAEKVWVASMEGRDVKLDPERFFKSLPEVAWNRSSIDKPRVVG